MTRVMYDNSMNCGRCIEIKCTAGNVGTNCDSGKTTIVQVTDRKALVSTNPGV